MCKKLLSLLLICLLMLPCFPALAENGKILTCGDYEYSLNDDGTATITEYSGNETVLTVPAEIDGYRVTSIGDHAFSRCYFLTSIFLPDSVTSIGEGAFYSCESLTSISLPDSVTSIGDESFLFCNNLTSITIPDSLTSIGVNPFDCCYNLTEIFVSASHPTLEVIDGVLFEKTTNTLIFYPCTKADESYAVPQGVRSIGNYAFSWNDSLTSITIPDSLTSVGGNPFEDCFSLEHIYISSNHPAFAVIDDVLFEKSSNTLIFYPRIRTNESYTVPQGICSIGLYAFSWNSYLTSITLPDSLTSIDDAAFNGCDLLSNINLPDSLISIGDYAFSHCTSMTSLSLPDSLTSIGAYAFYACDSLTNITLPDSLTSIDNCTFLACDSLTSITLPDSVTSIGDYAFKDCRSLTSISLPDNVTFIGDDAFNGCPNLTLTVPQGSYAEQYAMENDIPYVYSIKPEILIFPK